MTGFRRLISQKARTVLIGASIATSFVAIADRVQTASAAPQTQIKESKVEEGEAYAKQLLLLMDRDKNGKVSHEEFMAFMEAEFQRLDKNKDGELDVKELTQTRLYHSGSRR